MREAGVALTLTTRPRRLAQRRNALQMASAQFVVAPAAVRGFDFTLEARWTPFVLLLRKNCQPVTDCTGGKEAKSRGGKAVAPYLSIPFFFFFSP